MIAQLIGTIHQRFIKTGVNITTKKLNTVLNAPINKSVIVIEGVDMLNMFADGKPAIAPLLNVYIIKIKPYIKNTAKIN